MGKAYNKGHHNTVQLCGNTRYCQRDILSVNSQRTIISKGVIQNDGNSHHNGMIQKITGTQFCNFRHIFLFQPQHISSDRKSFEFRKIGNTQHSTCDLADRRSQGCAMDPPLEHKHE
jgi:hypothetical protein